MVDICGMEALRNNQSRDKVCELMICPENASSPNMNMLSSKYLGL